MEPESWDAWREASTRRHAADMVRVQEWPLEGAFERAAALFSRIVPDGRDTPGHEFRWIVAESGAVVGALWFAPEREVGQGAAFIWDIFIDDNERGRGYGQAAMEALEPLARSLGYDTIRLQVLSDNAPARHLYQAVGYAETYIAMNKRIG
jgi:GNAT superfamily N-acetyltransferase